MSNWFGKWYVVLWDGKFKIVALGLGEGFEEIKSVVFTRKVKRFWPFWVSVTTPTLRGLNCINTGEN